MSFNSVTVVRPYEQIVKQIQQAIRDGHYPRGAKLPTERELSETFGVSRAVVREAVKVLTAQGLVESRQGSGTFVLSSEAPFVSRTIVLDVPVETHAIQQLIETRKAFDRLAAEWAAQRRSLDQAREITRLAEVSVAAADADDLIGFGIADRAFHHLIDSAGNNIYLATASQSIRQIQSELIAGFASVQGSLRIAGGQHFRIAQAIADQDAGRAGEESATHAQYTGTTLSLIPEDMRRRIAGLPPADPTHGPIQKGA